MKRTVDDVTTERNKIQKLTELTDAATLLEDYNEVISVNENVNPSRTHCYETLSCINMLPAMGREEISNAKHETLNDDACIIVNEITAAFRRINYQDAILYKDFMKHYSDIGHAFSIDCERSYIIPFALDFDCKMCKEHDVPCGQSVSYAYLNCFKREIIDILKAYLPESELEKLYIYKSDPGCGLHVYFTFSVSMIAYKMLLDVLRVELSEMSTAKYILDVVTHMPLPGSGKHDKRRYFLANGFRVDDNTKITSSSVFYEVSNIQTKIYPDGSSDIIIGEFNTNKQLCEYDDDDIGVTFNDSSPANPWDVSMLLNSDSYIVMPFKTKLELVNEIPIAISVSRRRKEQFNSVNYPALAHYINTYRDVVVQDISAIVCTHTDSLQKILNDLCRKISTSAYDTKESNPNANNIVYLFRLASESNYGNAFYIIVSAIMYCINVQKKVDVGSNEQEKDKILNRLIELCSDPHLLKIMNAIKNVKCYEELSRAFQDSSDPFRHLTYFVMMKTCGISPFDSTMTVVEKASNYINDNMLTRNNSDKLILLYTICIHAFKTSHTSEHIFNYIGGLYKESKNYKSFVCQMDTTLIIEKGKAIIGQKKDDGQEHAYEALLRFLATMKPKNVNFSNYTYFINTNLGVFNTITNMYMNPVPFLYFRVAKAYVVMPSDISLSTANSPINLQSLNNSICNMFEQRLDCVMSKYLESINDFFYLTILVPGLLDLENCSYDFETACDIFESLKNVIFNDIKGSSNGRQFYLDPVVRKYPYNRTCFVRIASIIMMIIDQDLEFTLKTIARLLELDQTLPLHTDITITDPLFAIIYVSLMLLHFLDAYDNKYFKLDDGTDKNNFISDDMFSVKIFDSLSPNNLQLGNAKILWTNASLLIFGRTLPENENCTLLTLTELLSYNAAKIRDWFDFTSVLFQPGNCRKHFQLYWGPPRCGKSTLTKALLDASAGATYKTLDNLKDNIDTNSAATTVVQIFRSYLTVINEVSHISSSLVKSLTGEDAINKRAMYAEELSELHPITYIISCANNLPTINEADEAIRDRIVIFKFMSTCQEHLYEYTNTLQGFTRMVLQNRKFNPSTLSVSLSNLLYAYHRIKRDESGSVKPRLTNQESIDAINQFMRKNNYVYDLMHRVQINLVTHAEITADELQRVISPALTQYYPKKMYSKFKTDFDVLFMRYYRSVGDKYCGIGIVKQENQMNTSYAVKLLKLKITNDANTPPIKNKTIKARMNKLKIPISAFNDILKELIDMGFIYDDKNLVFTNMLVV